MGDVSFATPERPSFGTDISVPAMLRSLPDAVKVTLYTDLFGQTVNDSVARELALAPLFQNEQPGKRRVVYEIILDDGSRCYRVAVDYARKDGKVVFYGPDDEVVGDSLDEATVRYVHPLGLD